MAFNEADHPRNPKDSPNGTGGKFTVKTTVGDDADLDGGVVTPFGKASLATDVVEMLDDQKYYNNRQEEVGTYRCDNGDLLLHGDDSNQTVLIHPQRHEDGTISCTCSTLGGMDEDEIDGILRGTHPHSVRTDEYHTPSVRVTRSSRGQIQVEGDGRDPMRLAWAVNRAAEDWREYEEYHDPVIYDAFEDPDGSFVVPEAGDGGVLFREGMEPNIYTDAPFEDREELRREYVERVSELIHDEYGLDVKDELGERFDARYDMLMNSMREETSKGLANGELGRDAAEWLSKRTDPELNRLGKDWLASHADA